MNLADFRKKYDERSLFKKLLSLGAKLSIDNIFVKCYNGGGIGVNLLKAIKELVSKGLITVKCPKSKESKFGIGELFSDLEEHKNDFIVCKLCKGKLLSFNIKVKGLEVSYFLIHDLLEHPDSVKNNKIVKKLLNLL